MESQATKKPHGEISHFDFPPSLNRSIVENLAERMYEKRKLGALELEKVIRELINGGTTNHTSEALPEIEQIISFFSKEFAFSTKGNYKKGGLIGLASISIALGHEVHLYLPSIIVPVLQSFADPDPRVRYYAIESLFNITKVARHHVLDFFKELFDLLLQLSSDPSSSVKVGTQLLNNMLKTIVTQNVNFDIEKFIPMLKERIVVKDPYSRQFLLSWIKLLNNVPGISLIKYLPDILDELFDILKDPNPEILAEINSILNQFSDELFEHPDMIDFSITKILKKHAITTPNDPSRGHHFVDESGNKITTSNKACTITKIRAINWLERLLDIGEEIQLVAYTEDFFTSFLPNLETSLDVDIQKAASNAERKVYKLVQKTSIPISTSPILQFLVLQFPTESGKPRLIALEWLKLLYLKYSEDFSPYLEKILPILHRSLSDPDENVAQSDVEILGMFAQSDANFLQVMDSLIHLLHSDRKFLPRIPFIIRIMTRFVNVQKIFMHFSKALETMAHSANHFVNEMVKALNFILLASEEAKSLREVLMGEKGQKACANLFSHLYSSWAYSPVSILSICLLCGAFHHAAELVLKYSQYQVSVDFLVEIDQLVKLIESPVFVGVRMRLLDPANNFFLFKFLYGILMLLPQSEAYSLLRKRLNSVSQFCILQSNIKNITEEPASNLKDIQFPQLMKNFESIQSKIRK